MIEELHKNRYYECYPCYTEVNDLDSVYGLVIKFAFHWYSWNIKSPYMLMEYWSKDEIIYHSLTDKDLDYLYRVIKNYVMDD